jgi:flagellar biosynthetic protein FlhB
MADSSKTEQATPRRQEKAREMGQVARSRELPAVLALAALVGVLTMVAPLAITHWSILFRDTLDEASTADITANGPILYWSAVEVLRWIVPLLLGAFAVSLFSGVAQGGINFAPQALELKFERFNPASKLGQIFSPMGLSNLLKSLLPFAVILWISINSIQTHWQAMALASSFGLRDFASFVGGMVFDLAWKASLVLLAWSGVDYMLTLVKMKGDMKMSKQEIKEENKESNGNPAIKSRIRQLQRAMLRKRSLKAAATATVVVTNPTHYAVALRYSDDLAAPIVVAKGADLLAAKIRQLARDNEIMLVENKPLAQALYKSVEVGDSIPAELYQAVAEVLVLVYRAQAEVRKQEASRRSRDASGNPIPAPQNPASRTQTGRTS